MGNACFSHCQKQNLSKPETNTTKREASFVSLAPTSSRSGGSISSNNNYYYDENDSVGSDDLFFDSDAYVWFDAFENFPSDDGQHQQQGSSSSANIIESSFSLSNAALKMIRTRLKDSFPNDRKFLNDDYIRAMACQTYMKDRNPRRAIESTIESLSKIMKWRDVQNLSELPHLVSMAAATNAQRQRWRVSISQLQKAHPLVTSLNTGSMYWHGLTKAGRPILWIHPSRLQSCSDDDDTTSSKVLQAQMMACQLLADVGIQYGMPSGITNVCVIVVMGDDSASSSTNIGSLTRSKFINALVQALTEGYPHRIHQVWIPTTTPNVTSSMVAVLMDKYSGNSTTIPQLADNDDDDDDSFIIVCEKMNKECQERLAEQVLWNGWEDLPTCLGGTNTDIDRWYSPPPPGDDDDGEDEAAVREGCSLTFDFYGMKDRMMEQRTEYEEQIMGK